MTQANNAMLLGISNSEDQMAELFDVGQRLAQGLGQDTAYGIESLVTGLGRQSKLMLDNLGIMLDVNKANDAYALKLNKTASELTDAERKQAFVNAAMEEGRRLVEKMGEEQLTMASSIDQAKSAISDVGIEIGQTLSPAVRTIASGFAGAASAVANYVKHLRTSTAVITETTSAQEKEEILLAKIAQKKESIKNIGWQLDEHHRQKMSNELLELQAQLIEAVNERKEKEIALASENAVAGVKETETVDMLGESWVEYLKTQQKLAETRQQEQDYVDALIENYPLLAEQLGLLDDATGKFSAQQRFEIQTEFNEKYIEAVRGTYELENDEITKIMDRYREVEEDKTKLTEMETALRAELHIRTAKTVAGTFAGSMKTMADAGMIGQKTAKRFAQVQALVDAYASANAAYKAMAGIPVIGPGLAVAAATAAIGAGLANVQMIEKAEKGFDGFVDRPTMFLTGEGDKREHVQVTPLNPTMQQNSPKGGTTVNISGGVIDDDFIRNELIPALNSATATGSNLNA